MFSSKYKQLLSLQNDYIERINKNAVKLEKQLDFLNKVNKSLTKQLGGATQEERTTVAQVTDTGKDQTKETDKDESRVPLGPWGAWLEFRGREQPRERARAVRN